MKLIYRNISIVILLVSLGLLVCCKKKEDKLVGNWKYVYLTSADANKLQKWSFYEDKSIISSIDTLKPDTGTWLLNKELLNGDRLEVSGLNKTFDGTYEIITLNKKYFIIQRILLSNGAASGAFLRAEFVKE